MKKIWYDIFAPMERVLIPTDLPSFNGKDVLLPKSRHAEKLKPFNIIPLFVSKTMDKATRNAYYAMASGIVIPGGRDIGINPQFDAFEIELVQKAQSDKKPVLGICRGEQILAVAAGGKLIEHIPDITEEKHGVSIEKHDDVYPSSIFHDIFIVPRTKAHEILKTEQLFVPSRHHQAVDNPGDLTISGRSPGGIIEIIEDPSLDFYFGMQTHPELYDDLDTTLYQSFNKAVKRFSQSDRLSRVS